MMHRNTCYFTGRVQGVGFRYTVQNLALRYNVLGYVRNLPDGRVELVMEGPDDQTEDLLDEIKPKVKWFTALVDMNHRPPRCFPPPNNRRPESPNRPRNQRTFRRLLLPRRREPCRQRWCHHRRRVSP